MPAIAIVARQSVLGKCLEKAKDFEALQRLIDR